MTRKEAIIILNREMNEDPFWPTEYRLQIHEALSMGIKALEREPKTGHWIKSKDGYMRCDVCGSRGSAIKARFCHHCGAKMVELQKRSDKE